MSACSVEVCAVDGCARPARQRGWCTMHYKRWWRHGDPLHLDPPNHGNAGRPPTGNRNGWRGENVGYTANHQRIYQERGRARDHSCAECGKPAHEWAFDEPSGFSTDLTRYRPLCRSCHRRADRGATRVA